MSDPLQTMGTQATIQHTQEKNWSYPNGEAVTTIYRGKFSSANDFYELQKVIVGFVPSTDGIHFFYKAGVGEISITVVQDGPTLYSLVHNKYSLNIYGHPQFNGGNYDLTSAEKNAVRSAIEMQLEKNPTNPDDSTYPFDGSAFSAHQQKLYDLISSGIEYYERSAYVLRMTQVASKRSTLTADFSGVDTIVKPPNIAAVNTLIGNLPSGEWLKQAPDVAPYGNQRWQISQEWWWQPKWSAFLYGGTGSP